MATQLDKVRRNFIWRLENLTPTYTADKFGRINFRSYDPLRHNPEDISGSIRKFFVRRTGSPDEDDGTTSSKQREAEHDYELVVLYPDAIGYEERREDAMALDRHDIIKLLRAEANYFGYNDANTSTDLNMILRHRLSDEVIQDDDTPEITAMLFLWRCRVTEPE